ncbi:hypothetical protein [Shouchella miscanthi]|uniref:Uncharacterized protein n=1 Tax=Shouchella miscanthi TaxID=2598861 RepID=A0ABU6NF31_9BACI|nr:hypothetical protein [Shouchella miscanthi]MED4126806.1 hypothetical protein [Shouchella miscanthi]
MKQVVSLLIAMGIVLSTTSVIDLSGPTRPGTGPASSVAELTDGPTRPGT